MAVAGKPHDGHTVGGDHSESVDPKRDGRFGRMRRRRSARLSARERLVLCAVARGQSTDEIAGSLAVSSHTVRTHIKNAMRKLNARTRAQAVAISISDGVIEP